MKFGDYFVKMFGYMNWHVEGQSFQLVDQSFELLGSSSASQFQFVRQFVEILYVKVVRRLYRSVKHLLDSLNEDAVKRTDYLARFYPETFVEVT